MKGYLKYFGNKLVWFLVTLVFAFILNFYLPRLMPGDPVAAIVARMAPMPMVVINSINVNPFCRAIKSSLNSSKRKYSGCQIWCQSNYCCQLSVHTSCAGVRRVALPRRCTANSDRRHKRRDKRYKWQKIELDYVKHE